MNRLINVALVFVSLAVGFLALEGFLRLMSVWQTTATVINSPTPPPGLPGEVIPPDLVARAEARQRLISMPEEWKRRAVAIEGEPDSFYWQGVLHLIDARQMRRAMPFPPKRPDTFRIIVVGDSLTYGYGVREDDTYPALLNAWLGNNYRVEVLNLGVSGMQSEDILATLREFVPRLKPNLIIYGVCVNDFLPSGIGEYQRQNRFALPLPDSFKRSLSDHSRAVAFISDLYDASLRGLHIRYDFFDDILTDFDRYQRRFARDVAAMNAVAIEGTGSPMVTMVLVQFPNYGDRGHQIARAAEKHLAAAGATVIPTEDYFRRYSGQAFHVSRWEGHPNEVAHFIWARMLLDHLRQREDMAAFRR